MAASKLAREWGEGATESSDPIVPSHNQKLSFRIISHNHGVRG